MARSRREKLTIHVRWDTNGYSAQCFEYDIVGWGKTKLDALVGCCKAIAGNHHLDGLDSFAPLPKKNRKAFLDLPKHPRTPAPPEEE